MVGRPGILQYGPEGMANGVRSHRPKGGSGTRTGNNHRASIRRRDPPMYWYREGGTSGGCHPCSPYPY